LLLEQKLSIFEKRFHSFQMKMYLKLIALFIFCTLAAESRASVTGGKSSGDNSDSTTSLKSNIVIFKMMTGSPASGSNGSLKQAGKVARTSSHPASVKNPPALPSEG
jgi:hypothetical protein